MVQRLNAGQTEQILRDLEPLGIADYGIPEKVTVQALVDSCVPVAASPVGLAYGLFDDQLKPQGVLVGLVIPEPMTGVRVGVEHLWWCATNGLPLLRQFEQDCKAAGCERVCCGFSRSAFPERMAKIYKQLGYSEYLVTVSKRI
jgi:hypothetical protein